MSVRYQPGRQDEPDRQAIGDPAFVQSVMNRDLQIRMKLQQYLIKKITFDDVSLRVCTACGISIEQLNRRTRATSAASTRKVFANIFRSKQEFAVYDTGRSPGTTGPLMSTHIAERAALAKTPRFQ